MKDATGHARFGVIKTWFLFFSLGLVAATAGGCALPLAAVAVPASAGAPVAADNVGAGRTESFWVARYNDVVQAALTAADNLSLDIEADDVGDDRAFLRFSDLKGMTVSLTIERRTDTVTRVVFNVGWTGSSGFARLIGRQIAEELNAANAFAVDWKLGGPDKVR